jgi:hypothetical protein
MPWPAEKGPRPRPPRLPRRRGGPRVLLATGALLALAALSGPSARQASAPLPISVPRYLDHVRFLASDELEGRGNGTPGLERAAEYIARQFAEIGLRPGGDQGTFYQAFELTTGLRVEAGNHLVLRTLSGQRRLRLGRDYYPLALSPSGRLEARGLPVIFAGYGIAAPELGYDDYAGLDVEGAAVLVFTHEPHEGRETSRFDRAALARHGTVLAKAMQARARGARLLLLVEDPSHRSDTGRYREFLKDPQAEPYGVSVVRVLRDRVAPLLRPALDLAAEARAIDETAAPRSRRLGAVTLDVVERLTPARHRVRNVVGVLPGTHPERSAEAIVVGAHYDHLGRGGRHSLAPDAMGEIHNGADDNASGTAALIELARAAAADRERLARTLVFVAFAGEELGLAGSSYYVNHPTVPLERTIAMVNLDMIGRPGGRVLVGGLDTAPELEADLKLAQLAGGLELRTFREGASVGSSDDTAFATRGIPAISFFSGFHGDYHRPSDDWDKIEPEGGPRVAAIALELVRRLASRPTPVAFVAPPPRPATAATGGETGYGPYFGSIPDFATETAGVRFAEVRDGSPAAKAGLRRGDILVSFGGIPIKTLYDFTFALRARRPGDVVEVVVLRDGKALTVRVELGVRP